MVMIAFAVLFGLLAVFVAQSWLNSQADARMKSLEAQKQPLATQTIVVAGKPLRFGNELNAGCCARCRGPTMRFRPAPSPDRGLLAPGKRVVLAAIEANEPVLVGQDHRHRASAPRSRRCCTTA